MKGQEILFSHKQDNWETPQWLFNKLDSEFHFNLDLAANNQNHKITDYITETDNALTQSWNYFNYDKTRAFCNPPYSLWQKFVEKAYYETFTLNNQVTVVMLLPSRTDTRAFHQYIYNQPNVELRFIKGRLVFELDGSPILGKNGKPQSAPFPSLIAIFR